MSWRTLIILSCAVIYVQGHGRLSDPPNRGSLWRFGYNSPANYDDDGLNCGGYYTQYSLNGGKCGVCGDAYNLAQPRPHELGGTYGLGYISANYEAGQVIPINIYLSAVHLGYWELRICPEPYNQEQECFDNGYLLELEEGGTKYYPDTSRTYELKYRLPSGLTCDHCVLQWQYTCGNNWGVCDNGTQGLGCGNQEQFYSCSDISIGQSSAPNDVEDNNVVTDAPQEVTSSVIDGLTHDFVYLNQIG